MWRSRGIRTLLCTVAEVYNLKLPWGYNASGHIRYKLCSGRSTVTDVTWVLEHAPAASCSWDKCVPRPYSQGCRTEWSNIRAERTCKCHQTRMLIKSCHVREGHRGLEVVTVDGTVVHVVSRSTVKLVYMHPSINMLPHTCMWSVLQRGNGTVG